MGPRRGRLLRISGRRAGGRGGPLVGPVERGGAPGVRGQRLPGGAGQSHRGGSMLRHVRAPKEGKPRGVVLMQWVVALVGVGVE